MVTKLNNGAPVTTEAQLNTAILQADTDIDNLAAAGGGYEIDLGANANISLITALEAINLKTGVTLDIQGVSGKSATLDGGGTQRGLFVYSGTVTIENLTIANTVAQGGAGGSGNSGGGGGGAGLGGGLFVANDAADGATAGNVTLTNVSFSGDQAVGGNGGDASASGAGGGGGMGGNGGSGQSYAGGGGGGLGSSAAGASYGNGGAGIVSRTSGGASGGRAAGGGEPTAGGGGSGGASGGGGGGGAYYYVDTTVGFGGGGGGIAASGGNGGYGGGGGGGGSHGGEYANGGGGQGGFGGGGGGGSTPGAGGFGGGGGGAQYGTGAGSEFGGGQGGTAGGGGGLGAGGDIFVQQGATLTIDGSGSETGTVTKGFGGTGGYGGDGADGGDYGGSIFLAGNEAITFAPGSDQTETISGSIADMTGSADPSGATGTGSLVMNGLGTLKLGAANTFTGGITIDSGTVELAALGAAGSGTITFAKGSTATLVIDAADIPANGQSFPNAIANFAAGDTIEFKGTTWEAVVTGSNGTPTVTATTGTVPSDFTFSGSNGNYTIAVSADQAPVTTVPGAQIEQAGHPPTIQGISVSDADAVAQDQTITVALSDASGLLSATAASGATVSGAGTISLTLSGTLAAVDSELATVSFSGSAADTITVATSDGRGGTNTKTIAVVVNQPVVTTVPTGPFVVSQLRGTTISGISIADADATSANETITVVLSAARKGALVAGTSGGGTVTGNNSDKVTITGTLAQVNADLANVGYSTTIGLSDTITVATSDSRGSSDTHDIAVAFDQLFLGPAPPLSPSYQNVAGTATAITVTLSDTITPSPTITVSIGDGQGLLSVTNAGGATVTGNGTKGLTIVGTQTQVVADLASLTYTGPTTASSDTIAVSASDSNGAISGVPLAFAVSIDQPVATTVPGAQILLAGTAQALSSAISIADADATSANQTITVTLSDATGLLAASNSGGNRGGTVTGSGTKSLTISGTLTQVNADLATLTYDGSTATASDTITVATNDGHGSSDTHTISVVNDHLVTTAPSPNHVFLSVIGQQTALSTPISIADTNPNQNVTVTFSEAGGVGGSVLTVSTAGGATVVGNGTVFFSQISGTLAQVNAALASLTISPGVGSQITMVATDALGSSDSHTFTVQGDEPVVLTGPVHPQLAQAGQALSFTGLNAIGVADGDAIAFDETTTVVISDTSGLLSVNLAANVSTSPSAEATISGEGTTKLTLSASSFEGYGGLQGTALLTTLLQTLTFTGSAADTITLFASDGRVSTDTATIAVAINQPVVTTVPGAQFAVAGTVSALSGAITIADADATSANETIATVLSDATGLLSANATGTNGGGTVMGSGTPTLTISGTLAQVNADLATLTYKGSTAAESDTVTVVSNDGRGSTDSRTIAVTIDQPPVTTVPGAQLAQAGQASAITGISVSDPDAVSAGETTTVVLSDASGLLSANAVTGATVSGAGTTTLTLSGKLAAVNTELASLSFTGSAADTISLVTSDGRGGTNTQTIGVGINQPIVTTVPTALFQRGLLGEATSLSSPISIADADATSANETISVTFSESAANVFLAASNSGGATVSGNGVGLGPLSISGTLAQVNAALATLTVDPIQDTGTLLTVVSSDGRGSSDSHNITILSDAPPIITIYPRTALAQAGKPTAVGSAISVYDSDAVDFREMTTVVVSDAAGLLSVNPVTGVTVSGQGTTTLTLSALSFESSFGPISGPDMLTSALQTLSFTGTAADTITVTSNDGRGGTDTQTIGVAVNQPVITTVPSASIVVAASHTAAVTGISIADADATSANETITAMVSDVTGLLSANTSSTNGGGTITGSGTKTLTIAGTLAQVNADLGTLTYDSSTAASSDTITVTSNDGRGSIDTHTIAVTVDEPVVTTVPGAQFAVAGTGSALSGAITLADADEPGAGETFTTVVSDATGLLFANTNGTNGGGTVTGGGTTSLTITGTLAQVNADLATLSYDGSTAAESDTITVVSHDGRGSSDTHTIAVTVDQPPVTTVPGAQFSHLGGEVLGIGGISVSDADAVSAGETMTVVLSDASGVLSANAAAGATVSGAGTTTLTLSGSLAAVNTELGSLTYTAPASDTIRLDDTITLDTSDGRGGANTEEIPVSVIPPAQADFSVSPLYVHYGDTGGSATLNITVSNTAPSGSETLDAEVTNFGSIYDPSVITAASGSVTGLAPGQSNDTSLNASFRTLLSAGTYSSDVEVAVQSDGTGIDPFGVTTLGNAYVQTTLNVDQYAVAAIEQLGGDGTLTPTGVGSNYAIDLGTVAQHGAPLSVNLGVLNDVSGTADLLEGDFSIAGSSAFTNTGFDAFQGLEAQGVDGAPTIVLSTTTAGTFTETITLDPTGYNPGGYSGALAPETVTITGTVLQQTGRWNGPSAKNRSGDFDTASDWSMAAVPDSTTVATLATASIYAVTSAQTNSVAGLVISDANATLDITGGTFAVSGVINNAGNLTVADGATLQVAGTINDTGTLKLGSGGVGATLVIAGSHVALNGQTSELVLSDAAGNAIVGDDAAATFVNNSTIVGAGTIGDAVLSFVNNGVIDATGTNALTIASAMTFINGSLVESNGPGGLLIDGAAVNRGILNTEGGNLTITGALTNNNALQALGHSLTIDGAVTGTGHAEIGNGATLSFGAGVGFGQSVTFDSGSVGTLSLGAAESFKGTVAGLAQGDAIDLTDFAFAGKARITAVATSGSDTVVTIKDGALTAKIALVNQFAGEYGTDKTAYALASDQHGAMPGTLFELAVPHAV